LKNKAHEIFKNQSCTCFYDPNSKKAVLSSFLKDSWDESDVVRTAYKMLVKYGKEVFILDNVNQLTIGITIPLSDSYGNLNTTTAVLLTMPKDEFKKYNWQSLKYRPIYEQMKNSCSEYYIHPAIAKGLDPEKLYLSF